ncbi:MAG: hypothetical protein CVV28_08500 [Methanobacteriales archaeon HGW-Methanobacteriales-1]|jgi:hypothetical protein|nr:MAG: hypothetical protein CVV28_08500 [Methanobacteriales archaeon HGW-Methanobacteriales-1]
MKKRNKISVNPNETPEPINHHFVSADGKNWTKKPGRILMKVVGRDEEDVDDNISKVFENIFTHISEPGNSDLSTKIHDCKHKMYAVRYHKLAIENEVEKQVKQFKKGFKPVAGAQFEKENFSLIYNTEALLFQVKSNLDILIQALGMIIPPIKSFRTYRHSGQGKDYISGGKVIKKLEQENYIDLAVLFKKNNTEWIQELVKMRDNITHYSRLKGFNCFVEDPYLGKEKVDIEFPKMPNGIYLTDYCDMIYKNLLKLYADVFSLIYSN